jgi:hypothetical protein
LGEVLFFDLFHLGGPDYLSAVIRGVNSLSQKQFVTTETFKDIALQNSPERLRSEVNTVLNSYFPLETNVLK